MDWCNCRPEEEHDGMCPPARVSLEVGFDLVLGPLVERFGHPFPSRLRFPDCRLVVVPDDGRRGDSWTVSLRAWVELRLEGI